jgi:hypothetical protein
MSNENSSQQRLSPDDLDESTYIVETISDGSYCVRLNNNPIMFGIGKTVVDAMEQLTERALNGGEVEESVHYQEERIDEHELLMAFTAAPLHQKLLFAGQSYLNGYTSPYPPFSENSLFMFAHGLAKFYFEKPMIAILGGISFLTLCVISFFYVFTWATDITTDLLVSLGII